MDQGSNCFKHNDFCASAGASIGEIILLACCCSLSVKRCRITVCIRIILMLWHSNIWLNKVIIQMTELVTSGRKAFPFQPFPFFWSNWVLFYQSSCSFSVFLVSCLKIGMTNAVVEIRHVSLTWWILDHQQKQRKNKILTVSNKHPVGLAAHFYM